MEKANMSQRGKTQPSGKVLVNVQSQYGAGEGHPVLSLEKKWLVTSTPEGCGQIDDGDAEATYCITDVLLQVQVNEKPCSSLGYYWNDQDLVWHGAFLGLAHLLFQTPIR